MCFYTFWFLKVSNFVNFYVLFGLCNLDCFVIVKADVPGSLAEFDKAIELDSRQKACRL